MVSSLIDLDRYPLEARAPARPDLVRRVRTALDREGCAVLSGFLSPAGLAAAVAEARRVADRGHRSFNRTNPYFTADDPALPADHPRRAFFARSNNFIAADNFPLDGPLRRIWDHPAFDPFMRDCFGEEAFHRYADPLADVIVNMAEEGDGFPWHFDTNSFTVTLALQNAESGGAFEYAPHIRTGGENFAAVRAVLDGRSDRVRTLALQPGDLQLFRGRHSLHRVTPLTGIRPRFVAIYSYVEEPDMVASPERCRQLYGRTLPIHHQRAGLRADGYLD